MLTGEIRNQIDRITEATEDVRPLVFGHKLSPNVWDDRLKN